MPGAAHASNARGETIDTIASYKNAFTERRCLIPVSAFYGWTDDKSPNPKWRFTLPGSEWFCFAGIWGRTETANGVIESYALTTLPPDPAFEKYHDCAPLMLDRADYAAWLDRPSSAKALFTDP
ncbi:SOS response-associated peptidase family protein [Roseomonas mucosa]|uniref:SOS response-associated peptidase family protein n=1 Tax=Roseomonas mucosa TaxID=207340 RepID=UPI0022481A3C|nr:SOS response-associated peptidase family protein [Roseomonas mucosa]UZO94928.1 Hypothetical protein RMP42_05511 [Roseomonas mucosa]